MSVQRRRKKHANRPVPKRVAPRGFGLTRLGKPSKYRRK